jgi:hypothetical protein
MKKKLVFLLSYFLIMIITNCETSNNDILLEDKIEIPNYSIVDEKKIETFNKAQLEEYAIYTKENYTKESVKLILVDIYNQNSSKDMFKKFEAPTVFVAYLYTSIESMKKDKSSWIGMLLKGPDDLSPIISFNNQKLESLKNKKENKKTSDQLAYESLVKYLSIHNSELCEIYDDILLMEADSRKKADEKYPNYEFPQHMNFSDKLKEDGRLKISKKYDIVDSVYTSIVVFGSNYCK